MPNTHSVTKTALLHLCALVLINLTTSYATLAARISIYASSRNDCSLMILGPIKKGDEEKFRRIVVAALKTRCTWVYQVRVYSTGGDLQAAIRIGEQVRTLHANTWAPQYGRPGSPYPKRQWWCAYFGPQNTGHTAVYNIRRNKGDPRCNCASACFFIWAGGTLRLGNVLGVHRPYFDPSYYSHLTFTQARQKYNTLMTYARRYLERMNVPQSIITTMFSTDSISVRYLTQREVDLMRGRPFEQEYFLAKCKRWNNACTARLAKELSINAAQKYLSMYATPPWYNN